MEEQTRLEKIKNWIEEHKIVCLAVIGLLLVIIIIAAILSQVLKKPQTPEVVEIPKLDPSPTRSVVIQNEKKHDPVYTYPEGRDNYIHIESVPDDGLYEQIEEAQALLDGSIPYEILTHLCGYIKDMQQYQEMSFIYDYKTDNSYTCWILGNDSFWRLKYFKEDKKITADGELKDFWYEDFADWDEIYQEIPDELKEISIDIAASMTAKIMEQYPYDTYQGIEGVWYWDKDDEENSNLYTETYVLSNPKYIDTWILEYQAGDYICMYRKIADPVY